MACRAESQFLRSEVHPGGEHGEGLKRFDSGAGINHSVRIATLKENFSGVIHHGKNSMVDRLHEGISNQFSDNNAVAGCERVETHYLERFQSRGHNGHGFLQLTIRDHQGG